MHKLQEIIDIDKFEEFQYDISNATGLAIITVDYKGKPVTSHSGCSDFCSLVRKDEGLNQLCQKCDSRGGLEAARTGKPFIYRCHMGIVDLAVPIIVDDQYLGALMAGQILTEKKELEALEAVGFSAVNIKEDEKYLKTYNDLQVLPFNKFKSMAQMMFHLNNHIVNEKVLKVIQSETTEIKRSEIPSNKLKSIQTKGFKSRNFYSGQLNKEASVSKNSLKLPETRVINKILEPAVAYIEKNCQENISLEKIAEISGVSTFYFSKLFKKELGMNFSEYLTACKIKKAKELLKKTEMLIANIALKLGYYEAGYFTKVFKKSEGITPSEYRRKIRKSKR